MSVPKGKIRFWLEIYWREIKAGNWSWLWLMLGFIKPMKDDYADKIACLKAGKGGGK